jgi:hypothetical protein
MLARVLWLQGFVDQAKHQAQASLEEAQATDYGLTLCWVLHYAVCPVALMTGDLAAAERAVAMVAADLAERAVQLDDSDPWAYMALMRPSLAMATDHSGVRALWQSDHSGQFDAAWI